MSNFGKKLGDLPTLDIPERLEAIEDFNIRTGLAEMQFVGSTSGSSSTFNNRWVRIGNVVILSFSTAQNLSTGILGDIQCEGLPFTPSLNQLSSPLRHGPNVTYSGNLLVFRVNASAPFLELASYNGSGDSVTTITNADILGTSAYNCAIIYTTTDP